MTCNGRNGTFFLASQRIMCSCSECLALPEPMREHSGYKFGQHCGAKHKKWRDSIRVTPGSVSEVPAGGLALLDCGVHMHAHNLQR